MNTKNLNFETRIANRLKSVFAAFGQTINDFYLEAGIYFVGGFNAALVAWGIYTDLLANSQPLPYAIALAIIAFIAVEGLAVYLVGAAAKTDNGWLWFFSCCFALFFTYAHVVEANTNNSVISQYITIAIPFFVVVGYWARTVKIAIETEQAQIILQQENEAARLRQLEDEERTRKQQLEDEEIAHNREIERLKLEAQNELKRLKLEAQKPVQKVQNEVQIDQMNRSMIPLDPANQSRKNKKMNRQTAIVELVTISPDIGPTELTRQLNELGHSTSISTVKRDIKSLNGIAK